MQYKFAFITTALLVSASPAMSATLKWYDGAGCGGSLIGISENAQSVSCIWPTNGGSARSIFYEGTRSIEFFVSGGSHDRCTNGPQSISGGSGCATAPPG